MTGTTYSCKESINDVHCMTTDEYTGTSCPKITVPYKSEFITTTCADSPFRHEYIRQCTIDLD